MDPKYHNVLIEMFYLNCFMIQEKIDFFCLARGHISQTWLWDIFTEESIELMSFSLAEDKCPNLKWHMYGLIVDVLAKKDLFELGISFCVAA